MKLRLDLLKHLTTEDILEEIEANNHRYCAEPLFSKTGVGYLMPATPEEREQEIARGVALKIRLEERAAADATMYQASTVCENESDSHAKAQRRKGRDLSENLCAFAPLREKQEATKPDDLARKADQTGDEDRRDHNA